MARTPVLPEAVPAGTLSALQRPSRYAQQSTGALDPELPFEIGPMNGRKARESGLRLKA